MALLAKMRRGESREGVGGLLSSCWQQAPHRLPTRVGDTFQPEPISLLRRQMKGGFDIA